MEILTSRFGPLEIEPDSVIRFPAGLLGFEDCREWALLMPGETEPLAWLQSVDRPELAVAVVSPRRFIPDYRIRVARGELNSLELSDTRTARVLVIVGRTDRALVLNLKAPLVINVWRGLGRQVVTNSDLPIRYELTNTPTAWRRIA